MTLRSLTQLFSSHTNPALSVGMSAYMKNNFPFLWIQTPTRRLLEKERLKSLTLTSWLTLKKLSTELWNMSEREYQYAAIWLLQKYKKLRKEESIKHFERLITHKSWWDTVDSKLVAEYFLLFPEKKYEIIVGRAASSNFWLQRTAIQFQLPYKTKTDTALLEKVFEHTKDSKEFFVQKAMWWALREYSKTNPEWVRKYITSHQLPKLTVREGSKYI